MRNLSFLIGYNKDQNKSVENRLIFKKRLKSIPNTL